MSEVHEVRVDMGDVVHLHRYAHFARLAADDQMEWDEGTARCRFCGWYHIGTDSKVAEDAVRQHCRDCPHGE